MKKVSIILIIIEGFALLILMSTIWVILDFLYNGLYGNAISGYTETTYVLAVALYIASKCTFKIFILMKE